MSNNINNNVNDDELISAFCDGKKDAFDKLVLKYQDNIFNLCWKFLGDEQEAFDIAQETWIKVYRSLNKFRFESAFSTWLYRIAVNNCKNRFNSIGYRFKKFSDRLDPSGVLIDSVAKIELQDRSVSPLRTIEINESNMQLKNAIDSLPQDKKVIIILRDMEGLSYEEISQITKCPLGTVKSKLSRARLTLKEKFRRIE